MQGQEAVFSSAQILEVQLFSSQLSGIYHLGMMGSGLQNPTLADEAGGKQWWSHKRHLNLKKVLKAMHSVVFGTCVEKLDYWEDCPVGMSNCAQGSRKTLGHLNLLTSVNIAKKTYHL